MLSTKQLLKVSFVLVLLVAVSRLLGIILQMIIAAYFGTSTNLDAYLVASSIPQLLTALYASGATLILVPLIIKADKEKNPLLQKQVNSATSLLVILIIIICFGGFVFAGSITNVLGYGFSSSKTQITVFFFRWMMVFLLLSAVGSILTGILNAKGSFLIPGLSSVLQFLFWILAFIILVGKIGILALIIGAIIGAAAYIIVQLSKLSFILKSLRFTFDLNMQSARDVLFPFSLLALVVFSAQANLLIDRFFASQLKAGSISVLDYAGKYYQLMIGILTYGIVTPIYTKLSSTLVDKDNSEFKKTFDYGLKLLILTVIPAVALATALRLPIIEIFLERGRFVTSDTAIVSKTLLFLAPSQIISALSFLFAYTLFALRDSRPLVLISLFSVAANILFDFMLFRPLGIFGIALSSTLALGPAMLILLFYLNKKLNKLNLVKIGSLLVKTFIGAAIASFVASSFYNLLSVKLHLSKSFFALVILCLAVAIGILIYIIILYLLRVREVIGIIRPRLFKLEVNA